MVSGKNPPSITKTAFECPHCAAFTTQFWFTLFAEEITGDIRIPTFPEDGFLDIVRNDKNLPQETKNNFEKYLVQIKSGLVFMEKNEKGKWLYWDVANLHLSKCYNCRKHAVWVGQRLVFPGEKPGVIPNADMPEDIVQDFEEARSILNESPRGAAALLRLCVQKLCKFLGEKGKNIDDDIASLVGKGLNPFVQKSLDVVRVIGNEAVHPGTIDLKDDRDTATKLLEIINLIADQMISHPKAIDHLYTQLPEAKRIAIDERNGRARPSDAPSD